MWKPPTTVRVVMNVTEQNTIDCLQFFSSGPRVEDDEAADILH